MRNIVKLSCQAEAVARADAKLTLAADDGQAFA
jgi:hypothetical protein